MAMEMVVSPVPQHDCPTLGTLATLLPALSGINKSSKKTLFLSASLVFVHAHLLVPTADLLIIKESALTCRKVLVPFDFFAALQQNLMLQFLHTILLHPSDFSIAASHRGQRFVVRARCLIVDSSSRALAASGPRPAARASKASNRPSIDMQSSPGWYGPRQRPQKAKEHASQRAMWSSSSIQGTRIPVPSKSHRGQ
eukprot:CAMPEP_0194531274 /NCGR_PEP_ID=MMETSP0253-20130528/68538_1 /TAXON_ID=2966 /ORGANISM="Noctiluca scintillans" /LENGTH=196 /DNA_ID=CAMNT_0039376609 /DNA_START=258 /DNA_END=849 /DNA_ORIENTATION=+